MDDSKMSLLVALFIALIQTLMEDVPSFAVEDQVASDTGILLGFDLLNIFDVQLILSVAALNDYRLQYGLLCFDDQLRYWVKSRSTTWFYKFLMSVYDDEC
jgi:hypothetical protein